ncbi:MAG: archease, partial [Anaerolineales bacterium]
MTDQTAGYHEIEHTADWQLEIWAPDVAGLLEQAARGMYTLAGAQLSADQRINKSLSCAYEDIEDLLVTFISELIYWLESEGLVIDKYKLKIDDKRLSAELQGTYFQSLEKEIKAVTYHQLHV